MILKRVAAVLLFIVGTVVVAVPMAMRLGWIAAIGGLIFGPAIGVMAGVLWASASSGTASGTSSRAVQFRPRPPI